MESILIQGEKQWYIWNQYESQFLSGMLRACILKIGNKI